jgi:small subunit ribosomal protein S4
MVSHGHILVNGKKIRVPSHIVQKDDIISIREGSKNSKLFVKEETEKAQPPTVPQWVSYDEQKTLWKIVGMPSTEEVPGHLNLPSIVEFYSR